MEPSKSTFRKNPKQHANIFQKLTYCWLFDLIRTATKRDLEDDDIYEVLDEYKSSHLGDQLESAWNEELSKQRDNGKPNLIKAVIKIHRKQILVWTAIGLFIATLRIGQTYLLTRVVEYFSMRNTVTKEEAYYYSCGLLLSLLTIHFLQYRYFYHSYNVGTKIKTALCSVMYKKILKLKKTNQVNEGFGQAVNLMSREISFLDFALWLFPYVIIGPILIVPALVFTWLETGFSALTGIGVLYAVFFISSSIEYNVTRSYKPKIMKKTNERIKAMDEIICGIKVIKMYAWENFFKNMVTKSRREELKQLKKITFMFSVFSSRLIGMEKVSVFMTLLIHTLLGNVITASTVYGVLVIHSVMRVFALDLPAYGLTYVNICKAALKRIQIFLMQEELQESHQNINEVMNYDIVLNNIYAKWEPEQEGYTLDNVSISIEKGKLCAFIGSVGSGKSSALQLILKEIQISEGMFTAKGKFSYASQDPWVFLGTVKQNILFGQPYIKEKYDKVIDVCALRRDFEIFPNGDNTIVGERGLCISGGQKSRINLARAIYRDADIYILDDPLSAVDAKVSHHLFQECIVKYLASKTRILVTHQVHYLKQVDWVIIFNDGKIENQGTWNELLEKGHLDFGSGSLENMKKLIINSSKTPGHGIGSSEIESKTVDSVIKGQLKENTEKGFVKFSVYLNYIKHGGSMFFICLVIFTLIMCQAFASGADYFVSVWIRFEESHLYEQDSESSNHTYIQELYLDYPHQTTGDYLLLYGIIICCLILFLCMRSFMLTTFFTNISSVIHSKMLSNILEAKMKFFNMNSSGRILNRFSSDVGVVDERVPCCVGDCFTLILLLIGVIVNMIIVNYWTVVCIVFIFILYISLVRVFINTITSLKRLQCTAQSSVLSHVSETMNGLSIIRSCSSQDMVINTFNELQDRYSSSSYLLTTSSTAFISWLEMICILWLALLFVIFFLLPEEMVNSSMGLSLTHMLVVTWFSQYLLRKLSEIFSSIVNVERTLEYTKLDKEENLHSAPGISLFPLWPTEGSIKFSNVTLRYDVSSTEALKKLSFTIQPRHKVGIVGRTGAGKSSLISALFRLTSFEGIITIDNTDITKISLEELRKNISIIPQDPVLFSASLRYNLDPFQQYKDSEMYDALEEVELKESMSSLDFEVTKGGLNLSVGQRQLICLARAILRHNKIIVLDEATANVDMKTDSIIQRTVREKFKRCTVLTIAHRLSTVMDSDQVIVMDSGTVVEYEHPYVLLQNKKGHFSKLVYELGEREAENLMMIAQEAYLCPDDHISSKL